MALGWKASLVFLSTFFFNHESHTGHPGNSNGFEGAIVRRPPFWLSELTMDGNRIFIHCTMPTDPCPAVAEYHSLMDLSTND